MRRVAVLGGGDDQVCHPEVSRLSAHPLRQQTRDEPAGRAVGPRASHEEKVVDGGVLRDRRDSRLPSTQHAHHGQVVYYSRGPNRLGIIGSDDQQ